MSLINDALKRARHQALEQDADGSSVSYRAVPAHSRRSGRPWMPYLVGGGTVALVMAAFLLMQREGVTEVESPPSATAVPAAAEASGVPAQAEGEAPGVEDSAPSPAIAEPESRRDVVQRPAQPEPSARTAEATEEEVSSRDEVRERVEPRGEQAVSTERPSSEQEAGARLEDGRTYLRRLIAMDGGDVVLGGIAYSETRPIAVINGSVVTPGDMISGFTVIAITPDHVELEADGARVFLALH